jgi:hypothetical protein
MGANSKKLGANSVEMEKAEAANEKGDIMLRLVFYIL